MRSRLKLLAAGLTVALTGLTAAVVVGRASADAVLRRPTPRDVQAIGETLVLVVADVFPDASAAADASRNLNARFDEFQGFYIASADDLDVTGILVQFTPERLRARCATAGGFVRTVIRSVPVTLECPIRSNVVDSLVPTGLRFMSLNEYSSGSFPMPCGEVGEPPCQARTYQRMLGDDGRFASGASLLVTAFRTRAGAEQFLDLAETAGVQDLVVVQARKAGGGDVGLGQEAHPDGSGPLTGPLRDQTRYQT